MRLTFWGLFLSIAALIGMAAEADFVTNARQLTFEGKRSGEGYFSPDGSKLVFQSERDADNPFYQIFALDFTSGDTQRISPGVGKTTCAFFRPGADEVLFASTHHDPKARDKQKEELEFRASGKERRYSWDYDEQMDIFAATTDGKNLRQLTRSLGYDAEAAYSPDGQWIVFSSTRGAFPLDKLSAADKKKYEVDPAYFGELYVMCADGSEQRQITDWPGYDGGPFFSPDGQRIVFRHFNEEGTIADVYTVKRDGADRQRVTDFKCMSWAPYYHPSGDYIIFTANKHGFENFELFIVDAAGKHEPVRVTTTDGFDGLPVFSPDAKKLSWTSNRNSDRKSQIYLADWNDAAARQALGLAVASSGGASTTTGTQRAGSTQITAQDARAHVETLASDEMEGRETAGVGAQKAAAYLEAELRRAGAEPLSNTFLHPFTFTAGAKVGPQSSLALLSPDRTDYPLEKDFRPLAFSDSGVAEGEIVFAGYGLKVPGRLGEGYNSFAGLDLTNKIVVVLRYAPENVDPARRQELNRYAALRYKALQAREHGAKAMLIATGPNSPGAGELISLGSDAANSGSGIIAGSISSNVLQQIFALAQKDMKVVMSALDSEDPHVETSFAVPSAKLRVQVELERIRKTDHNVIGKIEPASPTGKYVLVGAHYDHLGRAGHGHGSLGAEGAIHNGADDNASGCATVLELAAYFAANRAALQGAGVIFGFWSGEELGLLGSSAFAEQLPVATSNIVAYLNFDMVGRLRDNKLSLQGIGSSPQWRAIIEKRNVPAGFNLTLQEDPYLPTDTTAFYSKGIPVLNFFTSSHEDYHKPSDDADKVNYEGVERITKLAAAMIRDLTAPGARMEYAKVEAAQTGGARDSLRAYLGTIPDYATEVKGVKL
ncbi:MAG TPA: M28 family peptidase, partial [Methylomirabilota bacterium]|nr:M28 family peptidase [Methylomirabilota bacterium]